MNVHLDMQIGLFATVWIIGGWVIRKNMHWILRDMGVNYRWAYLITGLIWLLGLGFILQYMRN